MTRTCAHLDQIRDVTPSAQGCEECLEIGSWPGENWMWCYIDEMFVG